MPRSNAAGLHDGIGAAREVVANITRRPPMQLPMIPAVIAYLVPLVGQALHQMGPSVRVAAKDEKGGFHPLFATARQGGRDAAQATLEFDFRQA